MVYKSLRRRRRRCAADTWSGVVGLSSLCSASVASPAPLKRWFLVGFKPENDTDNDEDVHEDEWRVNVDMWARVLYEGIRLLGRRCIRWAIFFVVVVLVDVHSSQPQPQVSPRGVHPMVRSMWAASTSSSSASGNRRGWKLWGLGWEWETFSLARLVGALRFRICLSFVYYVYIISVRNIWWETQLALAPMEGMENLYVLQNVILTDRAEWRPIFWWSWWSGLGMAHLPWGIYF